MNDSTFAYQKSQLEKYAALQKRRDEIYALIKELTQDDPTGPNNQNPFTGDTRESRVVKDASFNFSRTRGGAAEVCKTIKGLNICGWKLGRFLKECLEEELKGIQENMESL